MAVATRKTYGAWSVESSLDELAQLAGTAGASVVGRLIQQLPAPTKNFYLGKGKLEELIVLKDSLDYNLVIFDDELSPLQQQNIENSLGVKILDRTALILDIFARHARTREGQLQVELAQHKYILPRLAGQWSHLERLGGGIGTRGPGESQLETDRRIINQKIQRLKGQIEQIRKHRQLYRQKRKKSGIPMVAIVGYTNAGKSTLLNALSQSDVSAEDKLFATLDPTTRRLTLPNGRAILITDTVGFIRKLPVALLAAFRATLEELAEAHVVLHVVDMASKNAYAQCQAVEDILVDLEVADKPRITALNKIDLLADSDRDWDENETYRHLFSNNDMEAPNTVPVSAVKKWGLSNLLNIIGGILAEVV